MKYTVTYKCGHEGTVELFGPGKERERKLDWYRTSAVCPDCYRASKRDADEGEAAKDTADKIDAIIKKLSLPALEGSEKQIKWATSIRAKFLAALDARGLKWDAVREAREAGEAHNLAEEIDKLYTPASAWWIETWKGGEIFGVYIENA